jgi:anti-sigma-K factor RskA
MDHQAIKELLPLAALDRLDPDEATALEEHLRSGCDECEAELREWREVAASLALSLEPEGPEERIWKRLDEQLHADSTASSRPTAREIDNASRPARVRVSAWRAATAVMAAGIIGITIYAGWTTDQLHRSSQEHRQELAVIYSRLSSMRAQVIGARVEVSALQQVLGDRMRLQKVLSAPDLLLIRLRPLPPAPAAGAIVAVSAFNKSAVFQATGLPATPQGKTYELWWITKEHGPVAAGLFHVEDDHPIVAQVSVPPVGEHVLVSAVTLEPAGGVSKPTGAMYLKGTPSVA